MGHGSRGYLVGLTGSAGVPLGAACVHVGARRCRKCLLRELVAADVQ